MAILPPGQFDAIEFSTYLPIFAESVSSGHHSSGARENPLKSDDQEDFRRKIDSRRERFALVAKGLDGKCNQENSLCASLFRRVRRS